MTEFYEYWLKRRVKNNLQVLSYSPSDPYVVYATQSFEVKKELHSVAVEDFVELTKAFEKITKDLTGTQDPNARKRLLGELRLLLRRLDRINLEGKPGSSK